MTVYLGGHFAASGFTDGTGHYEIDGLFAKSYAVCVGGSFVFTNSATGFLGKCYGGAAFNGSTVPSGATLVTLSAGQHRTGINIGLAKAAAISGKVTKPNGTAFPNVSVYAHNRSSGLNFFGFTTSTGAYSVKGLTAAAKGYTVCFNPFNGGGGTGFRPRCFKNVAWNGGAYPSTAKAVSVALGSVHTGVSQALPKGGAISGTVKNGAGNGLANVGVIVYSSTGKFLTSTGTNSSGFYIARGLAASSTDRVCAAPLHASAAVQYHGKCWKAVAYNGGSLPSGTNPVTVLTGATHTGINFTLSKTVYQLGTISGTVTANAGGAQLQGATVSLFRGSTQVASRQTDASGNYSFGSLRTPASSFTVCVTGENVSTPVPPATGFAGRCYGDVAWNGLAVPTAAVRFNLSSGQHKSGVNVALRVGGELDGAVFAFGTTTPVGSAFVYVVNSSGKVVGSAISGFLDGTFQVKNLLSGNYRVCYDGRFIGGAGFLPQCYNNVAWNGTF